MSVQFPLLSADDIEVKVKRVNRSGAIALLYKTARTDMDMLDKVVGPENWECKYEEIKGNLYCTLSVLVDGRWVNKQDCGTESRQDGEGNEKKGEASDAFKRAGFKWGIGRELYTAPDIFLNVPVKQEGARFKLADEYQKFYVENIGYDDNKRINSLVVADKKTKQTVFRFPYAATPQSVKRSASQSVNRPGTHGTVTMRAPETQKAISDLSHIPAADRLSFYDSLPQQYGTTKETVVALWKSLVEQKKVVYKKLTEMSDDEYTVFVTCIIDALAAA